ncbi:MAG: hypothetical protein CMG55_05950 [Candidatus Marinimicrobia bacterium]|nr:hypothetical protein [Candidatus Neomarinimicrobiota bacterium]|tara:strand:+ start:1974 stop:2849 length:876 start_codon:yes stop_codon:yes gene_type:complete
MSKFDFRTPLIYILVIIIAVLLILMRKMDQKNREQTIEKRMEQLEKKIENVKNAQKKKKELIPPIKIKEDYKGRIGIIIDDFGYRNDYVTDGFLSLDADLTYAVIPGHEHSYFFGEKAKSAGYEVIVHMPMENTGKTYGEEDFVLKTDMDSATIERRIRSALTQIPSAIGMNNHQGSKASADQRIMSIIARTLKDENKFFIDSRTTVETIGETTMKVFGVPTASRNIFLDNDDDEEKIKQQLMKLVKKAKEKGFAIGIGHVKPKTLNVLKTNIPQLKREGYRFEFVSKMLQ